MAWKLNRTRTAQAIFHTPNRQKAALRCRKNKTLGSILPSSLRSWSETSEKGQVQIVGPASGNKRAASAAFRGITSRNIFRGCLCGLPRPEIILPRNPGVAPSDEASQPCPSLTGQLGLSANGSFQSLGAFVLRLPSQTQDAKEVLTQPSPEAQATVRIHAFPASPPWIPCRFEWSPAGNFDV